MEKYRNTKEKGGKTKEFKSVMSSKWTNFTAGGQLGTTTGVKSHGIFTSKVNATQVEGDGGKITLQSTQYGYGDAAAAEITPPGTSEMIGQPIPSYSSNNAHKKQIQQAPPPPLPPAPPTQQFDPNAYGYGYNDPAYFDPNYGYEGYQAYGGYFG